jgi:hypothetical protein
MGWVASTYKNSEKLLTSIDKYHEEVFPRHRMYRHRDHSKDILKKEWEKFSGDVMAEYNKERAHTQTECLFCYEDGHAMLRELVKKNADVRILSFGDEGYQRFKMSLCSVISALSLPVHIVEQPKKYYFTKHHPSDVCVLVDDKPDLDLPSNTTHILIDRNRKHSASEGTHIVTDLREVCTLI